MDRSNGQKIQQFVNNRIDSLIRISNQSLFSSMMAKLRRGVGKEPGSVPELWEMMFDGFPAELAGKGPQPSAGERAVHTVLTLFALHQQSKDIRAKCMHEPGVSLGQAVGRLIKAKSERDEAIKRRFMTVVTANDIDELVWHLRGLVQLFRDEDVPLDYGWLAKDLFYFQFSNYQDYIRLHWGRGLYLKPNENSVGEEGGVVHAAQ